MAVFRVQKTQNYTIMSNHHLRNKALSLKARALNRGIFVWRTARWLCISGRITILN